MKCAHWWGITPPEWRRLPEDDRAWMLTLMMFENTREAFRDEWKDKNRKQDGNADVSDFAKMRKRMGMQ